MSSLIYTIVQKKISTQKNDVKNVMIDNIISRAHKSYINQK